MIKRDEHGQETWRYQARLIRQDRRRLVLEALFDRQDTQVGELTLARGDRFVEYYYTDRWYNLYQIFAQEGGFKGWYCNVGCPAVVEGDTISYMDLALDLVVYPDGRQQVLDEDEFDRLEISAEDRRKARSALGVLRAHFRQSLSAP